MKFVYAPEGAEPKKWDYNPARLMSPEAEAIERHTGMTFGEFNVKCGQGSFTALHGLLYVLLKREYPTIKYDEVQFCLDDINFEPDDNDPEPEESDEPEGEDAAAETDPKA